MKIAADILKRLEDEADGVKHGKVKLTLYFRDGGCRRYKIGRAESFLKEKEKRNEA